MKEEILEAFSNLGFKLEERDENDYSFEYEDIRMLYIYNDDDEDYISISVPGILGFDDCGMSQMYELMNKINLTVKYVKAYAVNDNMWLTYEHKLMDSDNLIDVIYHMIVYLEGAYRFACKAFRDIDKVEDGSSDDENDSCETSADDEDDK